MSNASQAIRNGFRIYVNIHNVSNTSLELIYPVLQSIRGLLNDP